MPPMPEGAEEGILRGMYKLQAGAPKAKAKPQRPPLRQRPDPARGAAGAGDPGRAYGVAADVWSVTSYKELRRDALEAERWNLLHPDQEPRKPYVVSLLEGDDGADRRGHRLHEAGAGPDRPLAPGRPVPAGHRRLRPQRHPRGAAPLLRGGRRVRRRSPPSRSSPSGAVDRAVVQRAIEELGDRSREAGPGEQLTRRVRS